MVDIVDMTMFGEYLSVGALGFVAGVLAPIAARLIGYVVDAVRKFTR